MATTVNPTTARVLGALKGRYIELKLRLMRDAFAGCAVTGLLASGKYDVADEPRVARAAYEIADALIAVRGGRDAQ
jgi:hypothetical protein